jgi:lycopene cyclase domain-containing protein
MTYLMLNLFVLLFLFVLLNLFMRRTPWLTVGLTALAMMLITAIFDNFIIISGIVSYDENKILGWLIGAAPIEDFAYTLAAVILVPGLWIFLGRKQETK